jgi:hypothetical protein
MIEAELAEEFTSGNEPRRYFLPRGLTRLSPRQEIGRARAHLAGGTSARNQLGVETPLLESISGRKASDASADYDNRAAHFGLLLAVPVAVLKWEPSPSGETPAWA